MTRGRGRFRHVGNRGRMEEWLGQAWDMLIGRAHGPLHMRLIIQPLVAAILAIRAGWTDARAGRTAYGWAIAVGSGRRRDLLREGWDDVANLFLAALVIDAIYQLIVFHWVYLVQALIVAIVVALPSYLLIRGPANRIARFWLSHVDKTQSKP